MLNEMLRGMATSGLAGWLAGAQVGAGCNWALALALALVALAGRWRWLAPGGKHDGARAQMQMLEAGAGWLAGKWGWLALALAGGVAHNTQQISIYLTSCCCCSAGKARM